MVGNMSTEILEAIHFQYEDTPEIEIDCYRYLAENDDGYLGEKAKEIVKEKHYCLRCGGRENEFHTKDGIEYLCPNCYLEG